MRKANVNYNDVEKYEIISFAYQLYNSKYNI
jgi:hypothetical protein